MSPRIILFYAVTAIFWFSLYTYVPFVAPYAEDLGASHRLIGLIAGAYGFTQMAIRFPLGIFSDRIGKRKIFVILGMAFAAAAGFTAFFFPSPLALLLTRALGGIAASAWVAFTVIGATYYPDNQAAKVMGHLSASNAIGRMTALLGGALLAWLLNFELAFLLGGVAGIAGIFLSLPVKEKNRGDSAPAPPQGTRSLTRDAWASSPPLGGRPAPSLRELFSVAGDRQLMACSVLGVVLQFVAFATSFGFVPVVAVSLGATPFQIGLLGVASAGTGIITSPLGGSVLPKKIGACATLVIGFLLAAAGSGLIVFTETVAMLFVVQIIVSVGSTLQWPLLLGMCIRDIPAARHATGMGFFQAVYGIGMFLGPFVAGLISHAINLNAAFIFTAAVGLTGAICTVVYAKKGHLVY